MPAVRAHRRSHTPSLQWRHIYSLAMPPWGPSPSLRRRRPMRRCGKWPRWRNSLARHHAPHREKVSEKPSAPQLWRRFRPTGFLVDAHLMTRYRWMCFVFLSETSEGRTPSPSISRHASFETDQVTKDFVEFLKNLQKPGREIHKHCRAFLMNMSSKKVCGPVNHLWSVWREADERPTCLPFRTWAQTSWPSVSKISTRTCLTAWWVTSKVGLWGARSQSRASEHHFCFHTKLHPASRRTVRLADQCVYSSRLFGVCGAGDGPGGEVHHDSTLQECLLSGDHRRREEGLGHTEQDQVWFSVPQTLCRLIDRRVKLYQRVCVCVVVE